MIRGREEVGGSGVNLVVDGILEGKRVRDTYQFFECIYKCILPRVHCMQPPSKKKVYSSPLKTRSGDGRTRRGRGGDTDIVPSEPLIAIERGDESEKSVFEGMVGVSGRRANSDYQSSFNAIDLDHARLQFIFHKNNK